VYRRTGPDTLARLLASMNAYGPLALALRQGIDDRRRQIQSSA
jgi:hypothetical protein